MYTIDITGFIQMILQNIWERIFYVDEIVRKMADDCLVGGNDANDKLWDLDNHHTMVADINDDT